MAINFPKLYTIHERQEDGSFGPPVKGWFRGWIWCDDITGARVFYANTVEEAVAELRENIHDLNPESIEIRRFLNKQWREREHERIQQGLYELLPKEWKELSPIPDHFAHVSVENTAMVAYTPDDTKGELDIQVRMKPGRYLAKFYPSLHPDKIRELACAVDKATEIKFAVTADEIEAVYLNGPNSCMAHPLDEYEGHIHPVRVYAGGDLSITYLGDPETKVTARAVVWQEKKQYYRIYGDRERLKPLLDAMGYAQVRGFKGARISKIANENDGGYIMPYIDGYPNSVDIEGDFFVIREYGDYLASSTGGVIGKDERPRCERCEERYDEEDSVEVYLDDRYRVSEFWCRDCADSHAFFCHGTENYFCDDVPSVVTADGDIYSSRWFFDHGGFICEDTDEAYLDEDKRVYLRDTERTVCLAAARGNGYHMTDAGEWYEEAENAPDYEAPEEDEEGNTGEVAA
jgi:hypothetical protein